MSTTQTSRATAEQRVVRSRLWWVGLLTIVTAVIVNNLIGLLARGLFVVAPTFYPLQPITLSVFTLLGSLGAILVFSLLGRRAKNPIRTFRRTVWTVLVISFIPDLLVGFLRPFVGTTVLDVGTLMLMHVATAMICLFMLLNLSRARA